MRTFKTLLLKYRSNLIVIISIILIGIAFLNIYTAVEVKVTSNDECLWVKKKITKDSTALFFDFVKVGGVSWNAGIRDGDQLVEIKNITLHSDFQAQEILNKYNYGELADYKYLRDGKTYSTKVYVKKLVEFGWLAGSLSALFWMLIGFIVLTAKPDGRIHRMFYLLGVISVLTSLNTLLPRYGDYLKFFQDYGVLAVLVGSFYLIGLCFAPFVINYFFWNFPSTFKFAEKKWVQRTVFIVPSILVIVFITVFYLSITKIFNDFVFFTFLQAYQILMIVAQITGWFALFFQYRKIKSREKKKPILLMLIAVSFGFAVALYTARIAPAIADTIFNSPEYYTPIILIAFVPLIFAYAIFKYQLMDVSVVVKNTIVYGTATATVASIYFFVIYVAGQSISSFFGVENQGIIAGIFFIIFALVFQSTKNRFQDFLTRRFYPEQFASQKVLVELSNELSVVAGLNNIIQLMKKTFIEGLKINTFGILLRDKDGNLSLVDSVGMENKQCMISESRIIQFLKEKYLITK
ncbi:MAG TPA: hypothetical protein VIY47_02165, partial [Ignavibacteriaceae bacterium]